MCAFSVGNEKRAAKRLRLRSKQGVIKRNKLHSSVKLFSMGVPVVIILKSPFNAMAALVRLVNGFLMLGLHPQLCCAIVRL